MVGWKSGVAHNLYYRSCRGQTSLGYSPDVHVAQGQACLLHKLEEKLMAMMRFILTAILLWLLTACGTAGLQPSDQLVQKAIALQISLTQKQLTQQLYTSPRPQPANFDITRLVVKEQDPLVVQNLPTYHIRGTYNLTIQMPTGRVNQQQNPFEVYMQRQSEGKTWRLILPQFTSQDVKPTWVTYLIR